MCVCARVPLLVCSTENMALLKEPARMKTLAEEMNSHTVGRANQLTYTVVNEMNEMSVNEVSQKVNSFLPGTSSLVVSTQALCRCL